MEPQLIDGRWELHELLGVGGGGRVWRAVDRLTGKECALKLIRATSTAHLVRVRREIAALRSLRLPGVVNLQEIGEHLGEPFLVMDLVRGKPFPGVPGTLTWEQLREPALRLLDVLIRVHSTGIIHRDLKPANILVDPNGRVVLLDFGLARGTPGDSSVTRDGGVVGTPRYLAPEQVLGRKVDHRADLFALGVMLYDALAGERTFDAVSLAARLTSTHELAVPPLTQTAPEVPAGVARVIQGLLAASPAERPASAAAVRQMLTEEGGELPPAEPLPLLERDALLTTVLAQLAASGRAAVAGGPGAGRTRMAQELAAALRARGETVLVTRAGTRPLASLRSLVAEAALLAGPAGVEDALRRLLEGGAVLVVDGTEQLDAWSRRVVERVTEAGRMIRLGPGEGELVLPPLSARALRAWFHGPEPFFHLQSDAADALHRRTGGVPGRLARELDAWVHADLAVREGARYRMTRDAVEQLSGSRQLGDDAAAVARPQDGPWLTETLCWLVLAGSIDCVGLAQAMGLPDWEVEVALSELEQAGATARGLDRTWRARVRPAELLTWPEGRLIEAHRRLAAARPAVSLERLDHLLQADDRTDALACALELARAALDAGRAGRALGLLAPRLHRVGDAPASLLDAAVATVATAALVDGTSSSRAAALHALHPIPGDVAVRAAVLLRAQELAAHGKLWEAAELAESLPPFSDDLLEIRRWGVRVHAAARKVRGRGNELVDEAEQHLSSPHAAAWLATWRGLVAYEEGDYVGAVAAHRRAVAAATTEAGRLVPLVNLTVALTDCFAFAESLQVAEQLQATAAALRQPAIEAFAYALARMDEYRMGRPFAVDDETRAASAALGMNPRHATLCGALAGQAWRRGDRTAAVALALESVAAFASNRPEVGVLVSALALAAGAEGDAEAIIRALPTCHARHRPQICALLALARPELSARLRELAELDGARVPDEVRLEVLSISECRAFLSRGPDATLPSGV